MENVEVSNLSQLFSIIMKYGTPEDIESGDIKLLF